MIKKFLFSCMIAVAFSLSANAQFSPGAGFKQLNFGLEGGTFGLYAGMDFGLSDVITIGPRISFLVDPGYINVYDASRTILIPSFRADYHYSHHIDPLPDQLDLYAGVSVGAGLEMVSYDSDVLDDYTEFYPEIFAQAGARWYFNESWGGHLEIKQGTRRVNFVSAGLSLRF